MFILYLQIAFGATFIFNSKSGDSGKKAFKKKQPTTLNAITLRKKERGLEPRSTWIWIISDFCKWKINHPITLEQD